MLQLESYSCIVIVNVLVSWGPVFGAEGESVIHPKGGRGAITGVAGAITGVQLGKSKKFGRGTQHHRSVRLLGIFDSAKLRMTCDLSQRCRLEAARGRV